MTQTLTTEQLLEVIERCKTNEPSPHLLVGIPLARAMSRELLANREAQPVAYLKKSIIDSERFDSADPEIILHPNTPEGWHSEYQAVFTAPPAPAVPEPMPEIDRGEGGSDIDYMQPQEIYDMGKTDGWNACRAAMLAQPVSQGYKLPMQPLVIDTHGALRFKQNPIVRRLLDYATEHGYGLNEIAMEQFEADDQMQLAQLIGYSLSGYGTLSYVTDESYDRAAAAAPEGGN